MFHRRVLLRVMVGVGVGLSSGAAKADVRLQGAGATFPAPLYQRWVAEYQRVRPDVKIDYQSIGSGGGIKGITDSTVDFAGSDAPMSKKEIAAAGGADNIVQVPSCAGGVVPAYHVPDVKTELKFTGEVLADIYLGKINKWNDPRIAAINPGVTLPDLAITPVWRTDGSGTNYVFTHYLATQSDAFVQAVGVGKSVRWPLGQGGKGNEGVAQVLQLTPGAIGYVEQNYADKNNIAYGSVRNRNGKFIKASPETVSTAGAGAVAQLNGHVLAANLWDRAGEDAYPIASFTYLIVCKNLKNVKTREQAQALVDFLAWATHGRQQYAPPLDYAPLAGRIHGVNMIVPQGKSHRAHRALRLRQEHPPPQYQPPQRPCRKCPYRRRDPLPRPEHLRPAHRCHRTPQVPRHGLPKIQPVSDEHL